MSLKQAIMQDIESLDSPLLLEQVFSFVQHIKREEQSSALLSSSHSLHSAHSALSSNRPPVLVLAGTLSDDAAAEMQRTVREEFSSIEGEW
jgi:hypothetical protein